MKHTEFPEGFIGKEDDLRIGLGGPITNDPTGWISFAHDGACYDDGRIYLSVGSRNHGNYSRFSLDRASFSRFIRSAIKNASLYNEAFAPTGLVLTPLLEGKPVHLKAESIRLQGREIIVTDSEGQERRFDATQYIIGPDTDRPKPAEADEEI